MASPLAALASILKPSTAPADDKSLNDQALEWCKKTWDENKSAYLVYHMLVWRALLMYAGKLWTRVDETRRTVELAMPDDDWTPMPNINRFSPAVDSLTSIFQMPEVEGVPQEEDDMDAHEIAAVANAVADWAIIRAGLKGDNKSKEDKIGLARQLFVLAGTVFTIVEPERLDSIQAPIKDAQPAWGVQCQQCDTYNKIPQPSADELPPSDLLMGQPVAGPPQVCDQCGGPVDVTDTTTQVTRLDPQGNPLMDTQEVHGVKVDIGNPLYCLPRPGATNMQESGWEMWARRMPIDQIKAEFDFAAEPDSEQVDGAAFTFQTQLDFWYSGYSTQSKVKNQALVVKFYVEPGRVAEFPDGLYAVMINGQIAKAEPWAAAYIEHPLSKGDYLKLPTVFFGRSVAFDLMEIQSECSSYDSIIKLHAMTSASDPIVADESTKVSEITGRGDKVIWWKSIGIGAKEPHRMGHGALDPQVYETNIRLEDQIQNISGAVAVFRGQQPGNITAASGIAQLRGQAEQQFNVPTGNWNDLWKETVRKMVKTLQKKMTAPQISALMGPDHNTAISKFLACNLDDTLEWVASKFGLPRTRDEKRQEMMELYDRGALDITDPNVKQNIFELFGDIGMESQFNLDATRARKENADMKMSGQPATVMPEVEEMAVHLAIHKEAAKKLDFDNWPDPGKKALLQHIIETDMQLQAKAMQGMMPPPGPPKPGAPPAKQPSGVTSSGAPAAPPAPPAGPPPAP